MTFFLEITEVSLTFQNRSTKITFRNVVYSALPSQHMRRLSKYYLFIVSMISGLIWSYVSFCGLKFQCKNRNASSIISEHCNELHILHMHTLVRLYLHSSLCLHSVHRNSFTLPLLFQLFLHHIKYIPGI